MSTHHKDDDVSDLSPFMRRQLEEGMEYTLTELHEATKDQPPYEKRDGPTAG